MGDFSESDIAVLTNTLNQLTNTLTQDFSAYDGPDVELVVSPVDNAAVSATQLTCLQLPTLDAFTRSGDFWGPHSAGYFVYSSCPGLPWSFGVSHTFLTGLYAGDFGYGTWCFGSLSRFT
jgi:hypothetical protein